MKIGDLIEYTDRTSKYLGIVIKVAHDKINPYQILWSFGEDAEYYKEISWVYADEIEPISERT